MVSRHAPHYANIDQVNRIPLIRLTDPYPWHRPGDPDAGWGSQDSAVARSSAPKKQSWKNKAGDALLGNGLVFGFQKLDHAVQRLKLHQVTIKHGEGFLFG